MNADPLAAVVKFLADDMEIDDLVDGRVFGEELPRSEGALWGTGERANIRASIVVTPSGRMPSAGDSSYVRVGRVRFDVRCYGATPHEAATVRLAVERALKEMRPTVVTLDGGDVRLHNAIVSGGPISMRDPDAGWPSSWSAWGIHYAEETAITDLVSS